MTLQQFLDNKEIESGLDFILSHFQQDMIFPRNVMATEITIDLKRIPTFQNSIFKRRSIISFQEISLC